MRLEVVKLRPQEADEGCHLEGLGAPLPLENRQGCLGKLNLAARAPGQDLPGFAVRHLLNGIRPEPSRHLHVTGAHLLDAATMTGSTHDLVGNAEPIHNVECKQRDMWGLENIAARVKHELRRLTRLCNGLRALPEAVQDGPLELQA